VYTRPYAMVWSVVLALGCLGVAARGAAEKPATHQASSAHPLKLASTMWPPFTDGEGRPRIALDLVMRALERAGYKSSTEIVPDGTLTDALRKGQFDGSGAVWSSADRRKFLLYSNAYFENRLVLVARTGTNPDVKSLDEIMPGKRLGVVEGYAYGEALDRGTRVELVHSSSTEESLRKLLHDEVDYVLADDLVIHHLMAIYPAQLAGRIVIGRAPLLKRTLHLAIRKSRPDAPAIIAAFNHELASMLRDGTYNELLGVHWIRTDIDGDGRPELVTSDAHVGAKPPSHFYDVLASTPPHPAALHDSAVEPRFVIRGVAYDSWTAVPDEFRTSTQDLAAKPRTLRAEVFQF
jgi:polar amino acid transport system substrate-binding protein